MENFRTCSDSATKIFELTQNEDVGALELEAVEDK